MYSIIIHGHIWCSKWPDMQHLLFIVAWFRTGGFYLTEILLCSNIDIYCQEQHWYNKTRLWNLDFLKFFKVLLSSSQIFQFLPRTPVQGTQIPLSQEVAVELLASYPASPQGSCSRECWGKGSPSEPSVINIVCIYVYIYLSAYNACWAHRHSLNL